MNTSSLAFPNMFDVSRNKLSVAEDSASVASRVKLMLLTEPTELYMNPNYGVGLRRYLFQYNNENVIAQIQDKLVAQLRLWEPSVDADRTTVQRGLSTTLPTNTAEPDDNHLKLTITLYTIYGEQLEISLADSEINNA